MSKSINLKDSKNNKFTRGEPAKGKETRKNIHIAPSLHQMIRDVIIEEETSMKGFASVAIDRHIDKVADMGDKPCFENADGKPSTPPSSFPGNWQRRSKESPAIPRSVRTNSWSAALWRG